MKLTPIRWLFFIVCFAFDPQAGGQPPPDGEGNRGADTERIERLEEAVLELQRQNKELRRALQELTAQKAPLPSEPPPDPVEPAVPLDEPAPDIPPAPPHEAEIRLSWKEGLTFESRDRRTFRGKIGGRLMWDMAAFSQDSEVEALIGDIPAATQFRRVRMTFDGELGVGLPVHYRLDVDLAGGGVAFKDVFIGLELPAAGRLQAGHFKEPFGMDELTSSRHLPFLERALPSEAFAPSRNTGIMLANSVLDQRLNWAVGAFAEAPDQLGGNAVLDGNFRLTGRLAGAPWYDEESRGRRLLHLAAAGSYINPAANQIRVRSRPEANLAPRFVDTGLIDADRAWLAGAEAALVFGPVSLQAEYMRQWVEAMTQANPSFDGFYVMGSWFITGEHRPYKLATGVFDRLKPNRNFSITERGPGAWELLARYSRLNLNDAGILGGRLDNVTAGLNWHLNPNAKIMLNYIYAELDRLGRQGDTHIIQSRFQVDF